MRLARPYRWLAQAGLVDDDHVKGENGLGRMLVGRDHLLLWRRQGGGAGGAGGGRPQGGGGGPGSEVGEAGGVAHAKAHHLGLGDGELALEGLDLALEGRDGAHAPVNRVSHPGICFVNQAAHGVAPVVRRQLLHLVQFTTCINGIFTPRLSYVHISKKKDGN